MIDKVLVFDISTTGKDPMKHEILGITTKTAQSEQVFTDREEFKLLNKFCQYAIMNNFSKFVGFNSDAFDVRFLTLRCIKHRIQMPNLKGKCIDVRKVITRGQPQKGTLTDYQELLGIQFPESRFAKMHLSVLWEADDLTELKDYLLRDVKVTWALYERLTEIGLV